MQDGMNWFFSFIANFFHNANFTIVGSVHLLDLLVVLTLFGILVRNFVHSAR